MNDTVQQATKLITFGLRPRPLPRESRDYAELVGRYRVDEDFANVAEQVAAGMGLQLLDVTEASGAVLGAQEHSPFAVRLADYTARGAATVETRVMHGLIQLAIAALSFPLPRDLEDAERVVRVSAYDIDEHIRELCRRLDAEHADEQVDPPADEPTLTRAWRAYARKSAASATEDGRANPNTTQQYIVKALDWLSEQGCMRRVSPDRGGTYEATERYRILVRDLAGHDTWVEINYLLENHGGEAAE